MPTSVETFEQLVRQQGLAEVVNFLLQLEKADVVAVRQKTKQLYREMNDWRSNDRQQLPRDREAHLFLAGLATFSKAEALGRSFDLPWQFQLDNPKHEAKHRDLFWAVVRHSRPAWLTAWFERAARDNAWRTAPYRLLRELADESLISYEPWLFAQSVAHWLNHHNRDQHGHAREYDQHVLRQLRADTVLLTRDLPQLFDFDTPADSAAIYRGNELEAINWLTLLPQLSESGHLDRADLLTRCLLALRRDFRRPLLTWFKNLFLALKPTVAERLARQAELVELLAHPLPLVVNFGLDQLKDLWAEADFAPAPLLLYAEGLMTRQDLKSSLKTLLGALEKLLKREPTLAPTVARLAAAALANADAAVQERAAKLLATLLKAKKPLLSPAETTETTDTIGLYADLLAAAARTVLTPFLTTAPAAGGPADASAAGYTSQLDFQPDISPATAIALVQDWHELLFLTGQVLRHDDPAALERWLDGLLRLRPQFPAGYSEQLRPYVQQVFKWVLQDKSEAETATVLAGYDFGNGRNGQRELVQALLVSWFIAFRNPKVPEVSLADHKYSNPDPLLRVEQRRLVAVETALRTVSAPLPLLSTPSHSPHWVAPTVLVHKLLAYEAAGQTPDTADLAFALARTAIKAEADVAEALLLLPQLRHDGLRKLLQQFFAPAPAAPALPASGVGKSLLKSFTEQLGRLISYKHQQPVTVPIPLEESLPWLGALAARTRYPEAVLNQLRSLADYPGVAEPWRPGWFFEEKSHTYKQSWNKAQPEVTNVWQELRVPTDHPGQVPPSPLLLYSLHARLSQKNNYYIWSLGPDLPFLLTLLPNNPAPLHWHLLRTACRTDNMGSEGREAMLSFLRTQLAAGPSFDEAASALLAVGLTHFAPVCRALALEVLLASVEAGRLVPAALGQALGRLLAAAFAPVQRLADGLAQARAIGPATDAALRQTLDALLPELPAAPPRNVRKLLEAYADLTARTGQAVPAAVQARLREWSASASLKKAIGTLL
jgi:hypothetical protein